MTDFTGAKAALFCGDTVLVYLRDATPGLPWAGLWDLPGGGREGAETAQACVLREIAEEFGLHLDPERLIFRRKVPSAADPALRAWLFGGWLADDDPAKIIFGTEGQRWELMPVAAFLAHQHAVPQMRDRVRLAWQAIGTPAGIEVTPVSALPKSA